MNALGTLLLLVLVNPITILVLRSGERIDVAGELREQNGQVIFRAPSGLLYSVPFSEVDFDASRAASQVKQAPKAEPTKKLKLSDAERKRLIEELENNHAGVPAVEQAILKSPPPPKTPAQVEQEKNDERSWRQQARGFEEQVRRASENLAMVESKVEQLRGEIAGLLSLGYKASQFTWQTTQLHYTIDQLPWARLEVERARRAYEQFREDARKEGVMPGWLR